MQDGFGGWGAMNYSEKKSLQFLSKYIEDHLLKTNSAVEIDPIKVQLLAKQLMNELDNMYLWYTERYYPKFVMPPNDDQFHRWFKSYWNLKNKFRKLYKIREEGENSTLKSPVIRYDTDVECLVEWLKFSGIICYKEDWRNYELNEPIDTNHVNNILDHLDILDSIPKSKMANSPWLKSDNKTVSRNLKSIFDLHFEVLGCKPSLYKDADDDIKGSGILFLQKVAEYYEIELPPTTAFNFSKRWTA